MISSDLVPCFICFCVSSFIINRCSRVMVILKCIFPTGQAVDFFWRGGLKNEGFAEILGV